MSSTDTIVAIDQGTTSTRAILFDSDRMPLASSQRELTSVSFAYDSRQPLQGSKVSHDCDSSFADREFTVGAGKSNVAAGDEVDTAANTMAMDRGQNGNRASVDRVHAVLQVADELVQTHSFGSAAAGKERSVFLECGRKVETVGE